MTRNFLKISGASLLALAFATACGGEPPAPAEPAPAPVAETPAVPAGPDYASFVASPGRVAEDTAKDANRKPAEVLAFTKIMPGQTVFEIRIHTAIETNDLVVYTTQTTWTMPYVTECYRMRLPEPS